MTYFLSTIWSFLTNDTNLGILQTVGTWIALGFAIHAVKETNRIASENEQLTKKTHRRICQMHYELTTIQSFNFDKLLMLTGLTLEEEKHGNRTPEKRELLEQWDKLEKERIKAIGRLKKIFLESQEE